MTTHLYEPKGTALTDDQMARLRQAFDRQRTNAEGLVERLRSQREQEADFIADTRTMLMVPVNDEMRETLPEVPQSERLQPVKPHVAIVGKDATADWYAGNEDEGTPAIGPVALNAHAHNQLGSQLGIPRKYYLKMLEEQPDLLAHNVNTWFNTNHKRRMVRTLRTNGGSSMPLRYARGIMSNCYRRLDALELTDELMPVLLDPSSGWQIDQCGVTDVAMHMELSRPADLLDVTVGDAVSLAVRIRTSDVASGALSAAFGVKRLVCSNLMTVPEYTERVVHVGSKQEELVEILSQRTLRMEDKLVLAKFRDVVLSMADPARFEQLVETLREGERAKLEDPVAASELLSKNVGLQAGELHAVQGQLMSGDNGPTVWGLANALTATARNLDFERKAELEAAAGKLMHATRSWTQYTEAVA